MLRKCVSLLALSLGLANLPLTASYADSRDQNINQLLVQGHFWYEQGRHDLAERAWRKVLRAQPKNNEANMGINELINFNPEQVDQEKLRLARELAHQQRYAEALSAYQAAFAGKPPTGYFSAEYYETLGGQQAHWADAVSGLRQLNQSYPSNPRFDLALGRVLSYSEAGRAEALPLLASLANNPDIDKSLQTSAHESWRNTLLWLDRRTEHLSLIEQYLDSYPDDSLITEHLEALKAPDAASELQQAYALFDAGKPSKARKIFETLLSQSPDDAAAMAGSGLANLKLKNFSQARLRLNQAVTASPEKQPDLIRALQEASFWADFHRARAALNKGNLNAALRKASALLRVRPKQAETLLLLGNIEAAREQYGEAISYFQQALSAQPRNVQTQQALIGALINQGNDADALALLEEFHLPKDAYIAARNQIRASQLQASAALTPSTDDALKLLQEAANLTPNNPWLQLMLARLYLNVNNLTASQAAQTQLQRLSKDSLEAAYALAQFHADQQQWQAALNAIDSISSLEQPDEYLTFRWTVWGKQQLDNALAAIEKGDTSRASRVLATLAKKRTRAPELPLIEAELRLALKDQTAALMLAQQYRPDPQDGPIDLKIRYATLLLKSGQSDELAQWIATLSLDIDPRTPQFNALEQLQLGLALQQSLQYQNHEQLAQAYEVIKPFFKKFSDDPGLQMALANIAAKAGRHDDALALYEQALTQAPKNADAISGVYGQAMQLQRYALAVETLDKAIATSPQSAQFLAQQAQIKLILGDDIAALTHLEQALKIAEAGQPKQHSALLNELQQLSDPQWLRTARQQYEKLSQANRSYASACLALRQRGNDAGLDQLTETDLPLEANIQLKGGGRLSVRSGWKTLDAGSLASNNAEQFGTLAVTNGSLPTQQKASGAPLQIRYNDKTWQAAIGTTPRNFTVPQLSASLTWQQQHYGNRLAIFAERESVTESYLSYAGTTDPGSGIEWGGVTRNGAGLSYSSRYGATHWYSGASYHLLQGEQVADNERTAVHGGLGWSLLEKPTRSLRTGLHLGYQSFTKNLSGFTLGQGGYFSPQDHLSLSFPLEYAQQQGKFNYKLQADFGVHTFRENNINYYPQHAEFQELVNENSLLNEQLSTKNSQAQTSGGVYTLSAEFGYSIDKRLIIGGWAATNNSNNFKEVRGGTYLRYHWDNGSQR